MEENFLARLEQACRRVTEFSKERPSLGIITGSGLGQILDKIDGVEIPYHEITKFPNTTVEGHPGLLKINPQVAVMGGRFHLYEGHTPDEVVMPVFLLFRLGVRRLIVTNASGGINPDFQPGDLVLIRDHINLSGVNALTGRHRSDFGPRFPDLSDAYSRSWRALVKERFPDLKDGVYACMNGPSYETPAEISMLKALGADMVGMSTVQEVIVAISLGMSVLGISCITNEAAGRSRQGISHSEVIDAGKKAGRRLSEILSALIET